MLSTIEGKLIEIQSIVSENKSELQNVLAFTKDSKVPIALKNMVKESFSCKSCHTAQMKRPILASRCCGCIIGCEAVSGHGMEQEVTFLISPVLTARLSMAICTLFA